MQIPYAEPYKMKMIEPIYRSSRAQREQWLAEAGFNLFRLRAEQVFVDVLTDSGTGAMSDRQWSAMMLGDESYAGATSYFRMKEAVKNITGFDFCLPTHQGRAAENVLFSALVKEGDCIPGNSHFDTTKGHIEFRNAKAIDCTIDAAMITQTEHPFKGNCCLQKLQTVLAANHERIPFVIMTVTNNTKGGQPVSMANLRDVHAMASEYGIPVIIDGARFAENAYFIKMREPGYSRKSIKQIVLEMFTYADAMTMSAKKDAVVNMGGFIAMRRQDWYDAACTYNIMFEGYITYGGLSGRDMNALATGLDENTEFDALHARISQVAYLADKLDEYGVPFQRPVGGHAVFIDARKVLPNIPKEEFAAQTLAIELYLEGGVRGCEIGYILADRDPVTRDNRTDGLDMLRLAIPRRTYTNNHMDVIAAALKNVFDRRHTITAGVRIVKEAPIMRHFTVELERLPSPSLKVALGTGEEEFEISGMLG